MATYRLKASACKKGTNLSIRQKAGGAIPRPFSLVVEYRPAATPTEGKTEAARPRTQGLDPGIRIGLCHHWPKAAANPEEVRTSILVVGKQL